MIRRVVITGIGVVSPLGNEINEFWGAVKSGKSAIKNVSSFDVSSLPTKVAAEIENFDAKDYLDSKLIRHIDKATQFALVAADNAIKDSQVLTSDIDYYRMGVIMGSGFGGFASLENHHNTLINKGPKRVSPFSIPMSISNSSVSHIAIKFQAKNENMCAVAACASSNNAIGDAFRLIRHGYSDIMITGGTEATITPFGFAAFCAMKAMSTNQDAKKACRPFDAERDGFVMGEGAGVLIMEEFEHAKKRGANIIAEIVGYGCSNDAYDIVSPSPRGEGAARCMLQAINDAGISPADIGYINAHGTSTILNDRSETEAIKQVFGNMAHNTPISSTKAITGHLIGASGAIEAIISTLALKDGFLPPTINYENPDFECDLDYIPNIGRKYEIRYALSNSFGFGGHNATIILKKFDNDK